MESEFLVIKEKIEKAIRMLLKNDLFLLKTNADEWAISHQYAGYLQNQFVEWHVDVEYNRDKDKIKEWKNKPIRPDIIVHIRDTDNNLLVIENKKSDNLETIDADVERLRWFTSPEEKFKYQFGALVIFHVGKDYQKLPQVTYFQKGKQL